MLTRQQLIQVENSKTVLCKGPDSGLSDTPAISYEILAAHEGGTMAATQDSSRSKKGKNFSREEEMQLYRSQVKVPGRPHPMLLPGTDWALIFPARPLPKSSPPKRPSNGRFRDETQEQRWKCSYVLEYVLEWARAKLHPWCYHVKTQELWRVSFIF
jgi:hypothetical protein